VNRLALPSLALLLSACAHAAPPPPPPPPPAAAPEPAPPPAGTPDAPFREQAPPPGPPTPFQPPSPKTFTLKNGLPVKLVERPGLPIVTVEVVLHAGTDRNPKGKAGLAAFVLDMLDQGTTTRDGAAQARAFEDLGARFTTRADADASLVRVTTLAETLDPTLELLADALLHPAFKPADVERKRAERLGAIAQQLEDAGAVEDAVLRRALFGESHPWGSPADGTLASTRAITARDLAAWHRAQATPGNAAVVVVGDVTEASLRPLLERRLGGWRGARPPALTAQKAAAPGPVRILLIDKPGAPQSQIGLGLPGVAARDPGLLAAQAMNVVFGGSFDSRLNGNLRTTHGWSYGAFSWLDVHGQPGLFAAEGAVVADKTAESVAEMVKELDRMRSDLTAAEAENAQASLTGRLARGFLTNEATADTLALAWAHDLPADHFLTYQARVKALTRDGLLEAARARLLVDRAVIVVVGPRALVEGPLKALGLGAVEIRDAEGGKVK
jgi:zinc protease